ncbi:hypothetical protein AX17_004842 [Amanita inopinata Kibby_2008]|nr:hypothetical protein AX17_004842 [Amanita inopinata Kibby_2008]
MSQCLWFPRHTKLGLLVPLVSRIEQIPIVEEFLKGTVSLVRREPETIRWFALKYGNSDSNRFAIFDTFASESGRTAHLSGDVAKALVENSPLLLSERPEIGQVNILASKEMKVGGEGLTAGLAVGLQVLLLAKHDQVPAVREFLKSARPLVEAEEGTPFWYAIEFPGTNSFAIIDFFPSEEAKKAHLNGKVAEALFSRADELLTSAPEVLETNVLAVNVLA